MAQNNNQSSQQNSYAWPGWDKSLGAPPMIELDEKPDQAQLAKFNQVLANIANLSHSQTAGALRDQLKALSGEPIHMELKRSSSDSRDFSATTGGIDGDRISPGEQPQIKFNPEAWGMYPAIGATELQKPSGYSKREELLLSLPVVPNVVTSETLENSNLRRGNYSAYGIAPPEQIFIHELGHYALFTEAKHAFDKALAAYPSGTKSPELSDPGYIKAQELINKGSGLSAEVYVTDHYENPAMKSINPNFIVRDSRFYGSDKLFQEGRNGIPDVGPENQKALENALKIHPVKNTALGLQSNADQLTPEQQLAEISRQANGNDYSDQQKARLNTLLAENATKAGLTVAETQVQDQRHDHVLERT